MLRIILELYDIEMPILPAHEMRLRSTAHAPYLLDDSNGHESMLMRKIEPFTKQRFYRKQRILGKRKFNRSF